jgi:hypothetical protein
MGVHSLPNIPRVGEDRMVKGNGHSSSRGITRPTAEGRVQGHDDDGGGMESYRSKSAGYYG